MKKIGIVGLILLFMLIVSCTGTPKATGTDELDMAIRSASDYLNNNIPAGSIIVVLNIQSDSVALSEYIIDELITNAVNDRFFSVIDRAQLDLIREEQNFQLSGEVDDNAALEIGRFLGAQTIVSGRVSLIGDRYRITIRAIDVQTAQIQGQNNWNISAAGVTITALMGSQSSASGSGQTSTNTRDSYTLDGVWVAVSGTEITVNGSTGIYSSIASTL
jgi:TolB-like protein